MRERERDILFFIVVADQPQILSKQKSFRVPLRATDFKLNCTVMSNPVSKVYWVFLPSQKNLALTNENIINDTNWIVFESKTTHTSSLNSEAVLYRLPNESKHEIYEKHVHPNFITSILYIRVRICIHAIIIFLIFMLK